LNRYTFRSGRQSYQDVLAANSFLSGVGRKIVVFAQDIAFGQGNVAAVKAVLGGKGHTVSSILVPATANDFTPFAQQATQAKPDLLFVAWAGSTTGAMWQALQQQGVFASTTVTTGLAERATWQSYGPASASIKFLSHYVWDAPKNKVNDWLVAQMKKRSQLPDLFTPDGFNAGLMLVHALDKAGSDDPDKMVSALEGWKFAGPKGANFIRPQDHALLQPMFQVGLVQKNGKFTDKVLKIISPGLVQPPVTPFK
jgi:branched-chain amino acid transport system substrate-binding protein